VLCYCDDCQAFLHRIDRADLLDRHGGTDIVQVAPAMVRYLSGTERIAGVRLSAKGMYRWYASCCRTPLGNTVSAALPFIGMPTEIFRGQSDVFGAPRAKILAKFATNGKPEGASDFPVAMLGHAVSLIAGWKLRGKTWPHPFFDRESRAPSWPVTTLSDSEREALRPLCGPTPLLV
jgi:hypothetical protein